MKEGSILRLRKTCSIILIFIFVFSSWGCTKKDNSKDAKQINIYVDIKDSKSLSVLKNLLDGYKKENSGVNVSITSSLGNMIEENISSTKPDVMFISRTDMIKLVSKGYLSEMKSYYEENKMDEKYYSIINSYGRLNDKNYGIPVVTSSLELLYNTDAIKKLNLNEPKDMASLRALIMSLNKSSIRIPVVINENKDINSELFSIIVNNTVDISKLNTEYDGGLEGYRNTEMKIPFDILKTMVKENVLGRYTFDLGNESTINKFNKGDMPLMVITSGHTNDLSNSNIKCFEDYSKYKGNIPVISEMLVSVPSGGKNGEEVSKLIKYIFSEEAQKKLNESGIITGNKKINASNKGIAKLFSTHLEKANESAIIYTDTIPKKLKDAMEMKIDLILSGKFSNNEWEDILNSIY